jgi:primosomal protein N' (replication factor Y)
MQPNNIVQVILPVPIRRFFDYLAPNIGNNLPLLRGMRVKVPFGRRTLTGIIWNTTNKSEVPANKLKAIEEVLDLQPLFDNEYCTFIEKCAQYYHHPIGEVAFSSMPTLLREGKTLLKEVPCQEWQYQEPEYQLNDAQQQCLTNIEKKLNNFQTFLLEGVTGSGKTEIYIQTALLALNLKQQILILVPEIALTPQTLTRFNKRFGEGVISFHSRMTPKQRLTSWQMILESKANIIIGTRSAIFLPFKNLGLIIVDEEHDGSYKQQEGFRYSARDMAILRAKLHGCPVILGSATPSLESISNAQENNYQLLTLGSRASSNPPPLPTVIDIKRQKCRGGLSDSLIKKIRSNIESNKQVLLFLNRRGYSPAIICHACGWLAECKRCDAKFTLHAGINKLICHHCEKQIPTPTKCPECQEEQLVPLGQGTERLEIELNELFPDTSIARIDSDTTRKKGSLDALLDGASKNKFGILIGTQMLAKGHHFPHLNLVALVDTDSGLFSTDFRAIERMAQLLIQVGGRAGREHNAGEVIIQTHHPEHPLLQLVATQNYSTIGKWLQNERKMACLPPYSFLTLFRTSANSANQAQHILEQLGEALEPFAKNVNILGPVPAPMTKRQGRYHFQLLLQANQRKFLHNTISFATKFLESSSAAKRVRWSCDVDPLEMF